MCIQSNITAHGMMCPNRGCVKRPPGLKLNPNVVSNLEMQTLSCSCKCRTMAMTLSFEWILNLSQSVSVLGTKPGVSRTMPLKEDLEMTLEHRQQKSFPALPLLSRRYFICNQDRQVAEKHEVAASQIHQNALRHLVSTKECVLNWWIMHKERNKAMQTAVISTKTPYFSNLLVVHARCYKGRKSTKSL